MVFNKNSSPISPQ
jgi:hypothetical protein